MRTLHGNHAVFPSGRIFFLTAMIGQLMLTKRAKEMVREKLEEVVTREPISGKC